MFCPAPTLIPTDPPLFTAEDPGFAPLANSALGNPDDFGALLDAILSLPLGSLENDLSSLSALDALLAAASFSKGTWAAANVAPLIAAYATASAAGDIMLAANIAWRAVMPPMPRLPQIPPNPQPTLEDLCGACAPETAEGHGGGGTTVIITDYPPAPPSGGSSGGDCLNPTPSGYVPGPCPSQIPPPPEPPPEPPPPESPPPTEPPPETPPPDYGGGGGGGDSGQEGYPPPDVE